MKIISKFHDYYDTSMSFGIDPKLIYFRKQELIDVPPSIKIGYRDEYYLLGGRSFNKSRNTTIYPKFGIIGFCGIIFPYYYIEIRKPHPHMSARTITIDKYCYSMDEVDEFMISNFTKNQLREYNEKPPKNKIRWYYSKEARYSIENMFNFVQTQPKDLVDIFLNNKIPVYHLYTAQPKGKNIPEILSNPRLTDLDFVTVKDPFTAFQDISMYISGVLGTPMMPMPEMPDDDMRDIKGFDKYSFRKGKKNESTKNKKSR